MTDDEMMVADNLTLRRALKMEMLRSADLSARLKAASSRAALLFEDRRELDQAMCKAVILYPGLVTLKEAVEASREERYGGG